MKKNILIGKTFYANRHLRYFAEWSFCGFVNYLSQRDSET